MNYVDEYDLVAEDAAGFPGSSPRSFNGGIDQFLASSPAVEEAEFDDDVIEIDDFDGIDSDSDLFVSDGPYEAEEAGHRHLQIPDSDDEVLDEDGDLVLDSGDDAIPTHYDTWDDQSGDNSSLRSSSPTASLDSELAEALEREFANISEDDDNNNDPASRSQSAENLESRYQLFQSQLNSLHESRERIADAFRELTARNAATSRRWEEELRRGLNRPLTLSERITPTPSEMSGSSRQTHRHHPYNRMPPPPAREGSSLGDMASASQRRLDRSTNQRAVSNIHNLLDELVEVEVEAPQSRRRRTQTPGNPARAAEPSARTVIDLTEEPDSPDGPLNATGTTRHPTRNRVRLPPPTPLPLTLPSTAHRNPRRQMSLNHRTPSLARSDGSLLGTRAGPQANVIDLTMDDDSSPPARNTRQGTNAPRANPPRRPTNPHLSDRLIDVEAEHERHIGLIGLFHRVGAAGGMSGMEILNRIGTGFGAAGLFRRHAMAADQDRQTYNLPTPVHTHAPDPLAGNLPNFNYGANGYNGGGSVKPVHQAPEKARDGFSRSTGEDQAFVCPSCEEELAYDPDEETRFLGTPATKKVKTKKDREEHNFWAVKECGHVSYFSFFALLSAELTTIV